MEVKTVALRISFGPGKEGSTRKHGIEEPWGQARHRGGGLLHARGPPAGSTGGRGRPVQERKPGGGRGYGGRPEARARLRKGCLERAESAPVEYPRPRRERSRGEVRRRRRRPA